MSELAIKSAMTFMAVENLAGTDEVLLKDEGDAPAGGQCVWEGV